MRVAKTDVFLKWIDTITDQMDRVRILARVDRLVHGNPGQHRNLSAGVSELKIDIGRGYRVYYTKRANQLLILLAGGNKSTQKKDIARAIRLAKSYKE